MRLSFAVAGRGLDGNMDREPVGPDTAQIRSTRVLVLSTCKRDSDDCHIRLCVVICSVADVPNFVNRQPAAITEDATVNTKNQASPHAHLAVASHLAAA